MLNKISGMLLQTFQYTFKIITYGALTFQLLPTMFSFIHGKAMLMNSTTYEVVFYT